MLAAGIVAEYNPFHKGHAWHIEQTRQAGATHIVSVMSGNFVQRGEPAIALKHTRVKMALENGADLVVELPVPWASAGAKAFALGAVSLIGALGCVDTLSFGSESGDLPLLERAAEAVASQQVNDEAITNQLNKGICFAAAREAAVREHFGDKTAQVLTTPNDTLAVEYIRAINKNGYSIKPLAVKRRGASHDKEETRDGFASASHIRKTILAGDGYEPFLPESAARILAEEVREKRAPADYKKLETALLYKLRTMTADEIAHAPDVSEGIENRIYEAAHSAKNLEQLFGAAKTKRYSHARIRRIVLHSFLGVTAADREGLPPYIRVLGMNVRGKEILRTARESASLPVVMKTADIFELGAAVRRVFELECRAADIFTLALPEPLPCGTEQTANVVRV